MPHLLSTASYPGRISLSNTVLIITAFLSFSSTALAHPEALPEPLPIANPEPEPLAQGGTTYVIPFSGAIYVTVPNSNASPAVPAVCPATAPTACTAIQQPNYCCPSGNYCGWVAGQVGCCPTGQTCNGLGAGGVSSVWSATTPTVWAPSTTYWTPSATSYCPPGGGGYANGGAGLCQSPTPYVEPSWTANEIVTTVVVAGGGGYVQPAVTTTVYGGAAPVVTSYNNGMYTQGPVAAGPVASQGVYCSTLYAEGPGLPTTKAGQCGTILVLQAEGAAGMLAVGWGLVMAGLGAHVVWLRL